MKMTEEERGEYILNWVRPGITPEQQIREVLPLVAGELGTGYGNEAHIRAARYTNDVRWLLVEVDRLRAESAGKAARIPCLACKDTGQVDGKRCRICEDQPLNYAAFENLSCYLRTINLNVPGPYRQPQLDLSMVRMRDRIAALESELAAERARLDACIEHGHIPLKCSDGKWDMIRVSDVELSYDVIGRGDTPRAAIDAARQSGGEPNAE